MLKRKIIIILGPTGSGKSALALRLAKEFNGFLISADSRQVYRGMDIGTNKDLILDLGSSILTINGIEECLVDIVNPDESFSLAEWLKKCKKCIEEHPDKLPIIVGGTGLYISALVDEYELPGKFVEELREKLETEVNESGIEALILKIKKIDPEIEEKIDTSNIRRVIRAAEIILTTKKPLARGKGNSKYEFLQIGIDVPRAELYAKLDRRAVEQFEQGLVEETQKLLDKGYSPSLPALSGIGYRQVIRFLNGEITKDQAIELNQRDNRRYAKRQMTWFRRDKRIVWIRDHQRAIDLVDMFLNREKLSNFMPQVKFPRRKIKTWGDWLYHLLIMSKKEFTDFKRLFHKYNKH